MEHGPKKDPFIPMSGSAPKRTKFKFAPYKEVKFACEHWITRRELQKINNNNKVIAIMAWITRRYNSWNNEAAKN